MSEQTVSEIDRIAFNYAAKHFSNKGTVSLESLFCAALIEYGAECVKKCKAVEAQHDRDYIHGPRKGDTHHDSASDGAAECAAAIRRMNDANKG